MDYLEETEGAIIDPYYEPTDEEWEEAAEHLFQTGDPALGRWGA